MAKSKKELLEKLSECVVEMEDEEVVDVANEYIESGYPALDGIMEGLVDGMNKASDLYDEEEYFVTDLLLCSDAMYSGIDILKPHLPVEENKGKKIKIVISPEILEYYYKLAKEKNILEMGGRGIGNMIEDRYINELSDYIFNSRNENGNIIAYIKNEKINFKREE